MLDKLGPQSLTRLIATHGAATPNQVAITTMEDSVTYAQLTDLAIQFACHLRLRGIRAGAQLAIVPDHPIIAVGLTLACSLLGCAWVSATQGALTHTSFRPTHILHAGSPLPASRIPSMLVDPSWSRPPSPSRAEAPFTGYSHPDQFWMIARSSGTTGEAKFIGLPEAAFHYRATNNIFTLEAERPAYLAMFPLLGYTGTYAMLRTLAAGGTYIYADPSQVAGRIRINVVNGSPAHLQSFMDATPPDATRIPLARVGGGIAGPSLFRRLLLYFDRVMHVYGSTEAGTTAAHILGPADIGDTTPSVGRVVSGARVEIVDAAGTILPPGTEGIVRIRTPSLASGYIGDPALSAEVFRDGWFHPGDLGLLTADGDLRITGRVNDQLNIGGSKRNPVAIDTVAQEIPGIADAACFTWPDTDGVNQIGLAVTLAAPVDLALLASTLREAIAAQIGPGAIPRALYVLDRIPRNPNGKIARANIPAVVAATTPIPFALQPNSSGDARDL